MPRTSLGPDALARVVTNDLVVRSLPEISDRSTIDPRRLQKDYGLLLFVLSGPVRADGYDWYEVVPFRPCCNDTPPPEGPRLGWVAAAGKDGEPWIELATDACNRLSMAAPWWLRDYRGLGCQGNAQLVLEGTYGGCGGIYPGSIEPTWLANAGCELLPKGSTGVELGIGSATVTFHVSPDGPALPDMDTRIRIIGHRDDPAAQTCRGLETEGEEPLPPEIVTLMCRAALVVTEIEEIRAP